MGWNPRHAASCGRMHIYLDFNDPQRSPKVLAISKVNTWRIMKNSYTWHGHLFTVFTRCLPSRRRLPGDPNWSCWMSSRWARCDQPSSPWRERTKTSPFSSDLSRLRGNQKETFSEKNREASVNHQEYGNWIILIDITKQYKSNYITDHTPFLVFQRHL